MKCEITLHSLTTCHEAGHRALHGSRKGNKARFVPPKCIAAPDITREKERFSGLVSFDAILPELTPVVFTQRQRQTSRIAT